MKGSPLQLGAVEAFRELSKSSPAVPSPDVTVLTLYFRLIVQKKLASKPHIAEKLIPTFPVACRR